MPSPLEPTAVAGRYAVFDAIASGGMATIHIGRLLASGGFTRTVAIKRLHPRFAADEEFVAMFLDEARLVSQVRHVNVVPTLDLVVAEGEIFVVMEYVVGESLSRLWKALAARGQRIEPRIVSTVMLGVLRGLDAAHDAVDDHGRPLAIVHRDVTPHNILIGVDGVSRLIDFGVARAAHRVGKGSIAGEIKGKFAYISPEQLEKSEITRQADIFSAGITLWEALTGARLFRGASEAETLTKVKELRIARPSSVSPSLAGYDEVVMKALERDPKRRYATAGEMANALERAGEAASPADVGAWVRRESHEALAKRSAAIARIESHTAANVEGALSSVLAAQEETSNSARVPRDSSRTPGGLAATLVEPPSSVTVRVSEGDLPIDPVTLRNPNTTLRADSPLSQATPLVPIEPFAPESVAFPDPQESISEALPPRRNERTDTTARVGVPGPPPPLSPAPNYARRALFVGIPIVFAIGVASYFVATSLIARNVRREATASAATSASAATTTTTTIEPLPATIEPSIASAAPQPIASAAPSASVAAVASTAPSASPAPLPVRPSRKTSSNPPPKKHGLLDTSD